MNKPPRRSQNQQLTVAAKISSGPLPSPEILQRYDTISPGAAGRIIAMAEDNNRHLQSMDKMYMSASYQERSRGQWFGLLIGLATLATSAYGFHLGYAKEAAWLGGTTVVGLVSVFVIGRLKKQSSETPPSSK